MAVSVIPLDDLDLVSRGWQSVSFGQCEGDECQAVEVLGIHRQMAADVLAALGASALEARLEAKWGWRGVLCPACQSTYDTQPLGADARDTQLAADHAPGVDPEEQGNRGDEADQ